MIRQQMDETRTALTDKLEVLEQQVVDTVQGATAAVAETVASAKEIVQDTVQTVKDSVQETVETVKDTFDLKRHVDRRPWTLLAGATALGFVGGYLLRGRGVGQASDRGRGASTAPAIREDPAVIRNGASADQPSVASEATKRAAAATVSATNEPSWLAHLGDTFQEEISQLQGLAVGTLLGIVRDVVLESVPEPMERQVEDVINGITVKLGGQLIRGRILPAKSESDRLGNVENQEDHGCRKQQDPQNLPPRLLKRA